MKLVLIRHGEPTYSYVEKRGFIGRGLDFAQLTDDGKNQAEIVSKNPALSGAQLIVSSPYTRALQTAAIISKNTGLDISIEIDLREWSPDLSQTNDTKDFYKNSLNEFIFHNGKRAFGCRYEWETAKELGTRAYDCLKKYLEYDKIIVVAHAMLIRQFGYDKSDFPYCGIHQIDFDENSIWNGFNASLIPR